MHSRRDWAESVKPAEPVQPNEAEEDVDLDEIEEEIEFKEIEELDEEEEKVVEEEAEGKIEQNLAADSADTRRNADIDMEDYEIEDDEAEERAKLLALPPHGCVIFLAGLSSDITENDLRSFCEPVGKVTKVRTMKGKNYAFVEYRSKELAAKAIKQLHQTKLKGKKVRCSRAHTKCHLFIGNVPKSWTEDILREAVEKMGIGVKQVDLVMKRSGPCNKGFAFVEYYNHGCASYSRKKMSDPRFKLDSNAPTVIWPDPSASQVKAIYVKNLPKMVTKGQLRRLFEQHGKITEVHLPTPKFGQEFRFGFVYFAKRSAVMKALQNSERYHLDGRVLECYLARPRTAKKGATGSNTQKGPRLRNCPSQHK